MAVGRFTLGFVTERFGLRIPVTTYIVILACLQVLFRRITSLPFLLVLLGFIGCLCGPLFPSGIQLLATKLPIQAHVAAVATAVAIGQIGGALAPLGVGLIADRFGIGHLLDVVLGLSGVMLFIWLVFSKNTPT